MLEPSRECPAPPRTLRLPEPISKWLGRVRRAPTYPGRKWRQAQLRLAHLAGQHNASRVGLIERPDATLVQTGAALRESLIKRYRGKYAHERYRILIYRPPSVTAEIWFGDLQTCLLHTGIACEVLPPETADVTPYFEAFRPNVFIATDAGKTLRTLNLTHLADYKRRHGCLRLLIAVLHAGFSHAAHEDERRRRPSREDEWRFDLLQRGWTADAFFSIFEQNFYERFMRDPAGSAVDYLVLPQACNPFQDHPLPVPKERDYFMATSLTDERLDVTHQFLRPILATYRGLWAGPRWGFGKQEISPRDMTRHYAQTRIALSPLVGFVRRYAAELTHRVYACAACGTFQITMPTAITHRYFADDELIRGATPVEYQRLFAYYVDRPDERNAIALRAMRRAYAEHTCFHRIDKLVEHLHTWEGRGLF